MAKPPRLAPAAPPDSARRKVRPTQLVRSKRSLALKSGDAFEPLLT